MCARRAVVVVAVGVALSLVACGRIQGGAAGSFRPRTPGVLRVATSAVPTAGFWEGAMPSPDGGFEQGLAAALAERFGLARVEVTVVPFADLVSGHLGGADMALAQLTPTTARRKVLHFSIPYLSATPAVLTSKGRKVTDLAAARDLRFTVRPGSTLEHFLDTVVRPDPPVIPIDGLDDRIHALDTGTVDAVLLDLPVASAVASRSNHRLAVAGQFASDDSFAAAMPQGSSNGEAVDSALRAFADDGTIRDLAHRWLGVSLNGVSADRVPIIAFKQP